MRKVTLLMSKQTAENQTNKHHQVQNLVKRVALGGFCTASLPTSLCFNHLLSRLLQPALNEPQSLSTILLPFHKFKTTVSNKSLKGLVFSFLPSFLLPLCKLCWLHTEGRTLWLLPVLQSHSPLNHTLSHKSLFPLCCSNMHLSKPQQNKYIPSLLAALIFLDPFSQAYCQGTRHAGLSNWSWCF